MDQKQTEGVEMRKGALDPTTITTLTLTQITRTLTQTDREGTTPWPRRLGAFTSPTPTLPCFSRLPLAHPTPPRPESPSESSGSARRHMCLLWRFTTSGPGPSRSPRRPATTNTVTNTETERGNERASERGNEKEKGRGNERGKERGNGTENGTGNVSGTETGRATGFLRGA